MAVSASNATSEEKYTEKFNKEEKRVQAYERNLKIRIILKVYGETKSNQQFSVGRCASNRISYGKFSYACQVILGICYLK